MPSLDQYLCNITCQRFAQRNNVYKVGRWPHISIKRPSILKNFDKSSYYHPSINPTAHRGTSLASKPFVVYLAHQSVMHPFLLFISYALAAKAANPLLTKRQSGTSGSEPGINACLDPENSAPNTVRQARQRVNCSTKRYTDFLIKEIDDMRTEVHNGHARRLWSAHLG